MVPKNAQLKTVYTHNELLYVSAKHGIPVEERDFALLQNIQTGSGDHPASY
jgi:hypothetical protein